MENFLNYAPLPELMQGAGVAVLTIFVSFAIGIFIHHLGDGEKKGNFLDLHIALDFVWFFKPSLIITAVMMVSPFFMSIDSLVVKSVVFWLWLITFILMFVILLRLYTWVKGDKDKFKLDYLSKFPKSSTDTVNSWRLFWSMDNNIDNRFNDKDFFIAFSSKIDSLLNSQDEKELINLSKLLEGFLINIKNRNKVFIVVFEEFFPKILEWHYVLWNKQYSRFVEGESKPVDNKVEYSIHESYDLIVSIFKYVNRESLIGDVDHSFSYFKHLSLHVEKYQIKSIQAKNGAYVYAESLPIYNDCFKLISQSDDSSTIWQHYFPESWKVTIKNFEKNVITRVWFKQFVEWTQSRIWSGSDKWDTGLEEIAMELFPEVEPYLWARILTFVIKPWSGNSRVKSMVESKMIFGQRGRIISGWRETSESDMVDGWDNLESAYVKSNAIQEEKTIELALFLYKNIFTVENLNKWIKELEKIEYSTVDEFYSEKESLLKLFQMLKDAVLNIQNKKAT